MTDTQHPWADDLQYAEWACNWFKRGLNQFIADEELQPVDGESDDTWQERCHEQFIKSGRRFEAEQQALDDLTEAVTRLMSRATAEPSHLREPEDQEITVATTPGESRT